MTQLLLVRHAVNDWVDTGRLAGWTPGVHLNDQGKAQASALGNRLANVPLTAIYTSPLERTRETADAIASHHPHLRMNVSDEVGEVRYGRWQGEKLSKLRKDKLWQTVQLYPSRVQFPDGETFRQAQARAVNAVEMVAAKHPGGTVVVVSHSDVIKLVLTHYLGAPLDMFQRIAISPASITTIYLGGDRPYIGCVNDVSHNPPAASAAPARSRLISPWRLLRTRRSGSR